MYIFVEYHSNNGSNLIYSIPKCKNPCKGFTSGSYDFFPVLWYTLHVDALRCILIKFKL